MAAGQPIVGAEPVIARPNMRLLLADVGGTLVTPTGADRGGKGGGSEAAQSSTVTDSNENEGFAKAVRTFVLGLEPMADPPATGVAASAPARGG